MKVRNGFVSNSSSSSFIAIGKMISKEVFHAIDETLIRWEKLAELTGVPLNHVPQDFEGWLTDHDMCRFIEGCNEYLIGYYRTGEGWNKMSLDHFEEKKTMAEKLIIELRLDGIDGEIGIYFGEYYS